MNKTDISHRLIGLAAVGALGIAGLAGCGEKSSDDSGDDKGDKKEQAAEEGEDYSEEATELVEGYYNEAFETVNNSLLRYDSEAAAATAEPYLCQADVDKITSQFEGMPDSEREKALESVPELGDYELEVHILDAYAYAGAGNVETHILYNDPVKDGKRADRTYDVGVLEQEDGSWKICGMFS
ncbi:hypothetical protein [Salininema proteolyticum]|uniref:Uncharacterized protein n=1 Tax=Salininema proteolyticum TaxID=1607685 RepID=A0ABV8TYE1_9ACTN